MAGVLVLGRIEHDQAARDADLHGGEPDAGRLVHRLQHVVGELQDLGVHALDGRGGLAQQRIGKGDDRKVCHAAEIRKSALPGQSAANIACRAYMSLTARPHGERTGAGRIVAMCYHAAQHSFAGPSHAARGRAVHSGLGGVGGAARARPVGHQGQGRHGRAHLGAACLLRRAVRLGPGAQGALRRASDTRAAPTSRSSAPPASSTGAA